MTANVTCCHLHSLEDGYRRQNCLENAQGSGLVFWAMSKMQAFLRELPVVKIISKNANQTFVHQFHKFLSQKNRRGFICKTI